MIYVLGSGGHASVVVDILLQNTPEPNITIVGPKVNDLRKNLSQLRFISDAELQSYNPSEVTLYNGVGSMPGTNLRQKLYRQYSDLGFKFSALISKQAFVSPNVNLSAGAQVLTGAIVNVGAEIGENSIINSGAIIEHDTQINSHSHIAPGALICGDSIIGKNCHIGAGAKIIQNISIGNNCLVASGAIVTKNLENNQISYGYRSQVINK